MSTRRGLIQRPPPRREARSKPAYQLTRVEEAARIERIRRRMQERAQKRRVPEDR